MGNGKLVGISGLYLHSSFLMHPAESSENTAICAKIRKFVRIIEELLPAAILDQ